MLGGQQVRQPSGLLGVAGQDEGSVFFQALPGQVASLQLCHLGRQFLLNLLDERGMPSDQHAGTRTVFRLRNEVTGNKPRIGRIVRQDDHFTGARDAVDVHLAKNVLLRQGHEQIARSDNLVDRLDALHTVRQCRHRLRTANSVNFADTQLVAGGQQIRVVTSEFRGRNHNGNLGDPSHLGGHGGHQYCGRIGGRSARYTDADTTERQTALTQLDHPPALLSHDDSIFRQHSLLKLLDIGSDTPDGCHQFRIGCPVRIFQFFGRDPHCLGGQVTSVQFLRVVQKRRQAFALNVAANPFDHLLR